jgi:hypothetical protein
VKPLFQRRFRLPPMMSVGDAVLEILMMLLALWLLWMIRP